MLFSAEITDFKIIYNVLRSITFRDFVIIRPMEEGLKFTIDEMRNIETSAYIPQNMFASYIIDNDEEIKFKISMKVFTECLNIFGDEAHTSIRMSYETYGAPLCLLMNQNDENITVDCEIKTMNVEDGPEINLADVCKLNKIVIETNILAEVLQRLDNCADEIKISISPDPPYLTLVSTGIAGESEISLSKHTDSISVYQCKESTEFLYAFANIRMVLKVMNFAQRVTIFTGETGLLGLQLVIMHDDKQMYVEYYVAAQFVED